MILLVVDFAENYTFATQKELQSEYYHSNQVSMLVHVLYGHVEQNNDNIESNNDNRHVIKEYHFYISDEHTHDTRFVQHCFERIYDSLKACGIKLNENSIWSDGFILLIVPPSKKKNIRHCWNFFEIGHGKGEHDGARACVKLALQ